MAELRMTTTIKKGSQTTAGSDIETAAKAAIAKVESMFANVKDAIVRKPTVLSMDVRAIPHLQDPELTSGFEVTVVCEVGDLLEKLVALKK